MTDDEISEAYAVVASMTVALSPDPLLGPDYWRERVIEARRLQDVATDLVIRVHRDLSVAAQQLTAQRLVVKLATGGTEEAEQRHLDALRERVDRLRLLREAVRVRRANLTRTAADVRLLLECFRSTQAMGGGVEQPPATDAQTLRTRTQAAVNPDDAAAVAAFYDDPVADAVDTRASGELDDLFGE